MTDSSGAETAPPAPPAGPPPAGPRPTLRRSRDDRMVSGLCGGLGRYTNIDPIVFRIVLAVLAVFGGAGLLLYGLGWLLVPDEGYDQNELQRLTSGRSDPGGLLALAVAVVGGSIALGVVYGGGPGPLVPAVVLALVAAYLINRRRNRVSGSVPDPVAPYRAPYPTPNPVAPFAPATGTFGPPRPPVGPGLPPTSSWRPAPPPPPPAPPRERSRLPWLTLSVAALVAGVLVLLDASDVADIPARVVLAASLVVVGLGLVVGAFVGRARSMMFVGGLLALALVITASVDMPVRGGVGTRNWTPVATAVGPLHYRLGAGDARLDLTRLRLAHRTVNVDVHVGVGSLRISVPSNADVQVGMRVNAGQWNVLTQTNGGGFLRDDGTSLRHVFRATAENSSQGRIIVDAKLGVGDMEVSRVTP